MSDTIAILREKRTKLSAKVAKMDAALEAARTELSETETAIKVLVQMGLAPDIDGEAGAAPPVTQSQEAILSVLGDKPEEGMSPRQVLAKLEFRGMPLNADYVRTALWRLAKRGTIASANSTYWRLPTAGNVATDHTEENKTPDAEAPGVSDQNGRVAEQEGPQKTEQRPFRKGENVGSSPTPPSSTTESPSFDDWDLDDVPF